MRKGPIRIGAVIITVVTGALSELAAQTPEAWVISSRVESRQESGPFGALLGHRAELALTDSQLARIREIQQRLVRENEPLMAQIRDAELWGVDTEEEAAAIAAVREQFGANASAAEREAEEVLTPEQRELARDLLEGVSLAYAIAEGADVTGSEPLDEATARGSRAEAASTTVRVENRNYSDVTVYLYRGSHSQRLGFVTGLTTQTFTLRTPLLTGGTGLRFQANPIGRARSRLSNEILVHPGDEVIVRIPPF